MNYTTIYFDLDDTLYPNSTGLWEAIRLRMGKYMTEVLGIPTEEAQALRKYYFHTYGTTLRGLQKHHHVDVDEYLNFVHNLPLHDYLKADPEVSKMISALPQRKFIFTNADSDHARRVIDVLGLNGNFEAIIDIRAIDFACKPEQVAYTRALTLADNPEPQACVMIDDSASNLQPAKDLGFTTILVNPSDEQDKCGHQTIANIKDLPLVLPELWNGSHINLEK
jgi:putative hydrolase of the HAD superfamily